MRYDKVVYTSITGGKDNLIEDQAEGKYIAFADKESKTWEIKAPYDRFKSPRRNSRAPKILAHQFIDAEYSLWIDGNIRLLKPIDELIHYLDNHDIAMFRHEGRSCIYDEAMACAKLNFDDPEVIIEQVKKYEEEGYGKQRGMCVGNFILRRHTPIVEQFNNYWWSEHCRHSVRDQISMFYALDKAGLVPNIIEGKFDKNYIKEGIIQITNHLTPRYEISN